ncbi:Mis12 protein-domain-containing protein [Schizophyllum fasciatum]
MANAPTPNGRPQVSPLLLAEALGFVPQLILDDITNVGNDCIGQSLLGIEQFLKNGWAEKAADDPEMLEERMQEVEHGLHQCQTLLEHYTDIAFDSFEAWCLRNIFAVPPGLPYVLPHQEGLDLTTTPEQEQELVDEINALREQLANEKKISRLAQRAIRITAAERREAEKDLQRVSVVNRDDLKELQRVPERVVELQQAIAELPETGPAPALSAPPTHRPWEADRDSYVAWVTSQLVARASVGAPTADAGTSVPQREDTAETDFMQRLLETLEGA